MSWLAWISEAALEKLNEMLPDPYPQVYEQCEKFSFNPHGWYPHAPLFEEIIAREGIVNVLEVGSWLGASTRHLAQLVPENGTVFAVDHWLGSPEHDEMEEVCEWMPTLYDRFLSNVVHAGLTAKIIPVRMPSLRAAKCMAKCAISVDLIYLDGAHDYASVYSDLVAWYPFVELKGVMCGDDWNVGDVQRAVVRFAQEKKISVRSTGGFWIYEK